MKNTIIKKVALFDPYLDTLGGGEKHILSILSVFAAYGCQVDILWDDPYILTTIKERLNISDDNFRIVPNFMKHNFISKLSETEPYEYFFYVTDGSYFFSHAKKNYVFCMYPNKNLFNMNLINKTKLTDFQFFANSKFSARYISKWIYKPVEVIYPFIDNAFFSHKKKEPIILSVGRFFEHLHNKRHDIIITAFKELKVNVKTASHYKLIIIGSLQQGEEESLEKLKKLARGDESIIFIVNPDFQKLISLYQSANIYWHAAGYGVDEAQEPYRVEHLGLTPLEAMAAGCVVFTHNSGGPKETIPQRGGIVYDDVEELIQKTAEVMHEKKEVEERRKRGQDYIRANFSYKVFEKNVSKYFGL